MAGPTQGLQLAVLGHKAAAFAFPPSAQVKLWLLARDRPFESCGPRANVTSWCPKGHTWSMEISQKNPNFHLYFKNQCLCPHGVFFSTWQCPRLPTPHPSPTLAALGGLRGLATVVLRQERQRSLAWEGTRATLKPCPPRSRQPPSKSTAQPSPLSLSCFSATFTWRNRGAGGDSTATATRPRFPTSPDPALHGEEPARPK